MHTYRDLIDHVLDYLGADDSAFSDRGARRGIQGAYDEFPLRHYWTCYYQRGRIVTFPSQTAGTVDISASTGIVTLADAEFPPWVLRGVLAVGTVAYLPATQQSPTQITLKPSTWPSQDVVPGSQYVLYADSYPVPDDFLEIDQLAAIGISIAYPNYCRPSRWLIPQQLQQSPGTPRLYTIMADPVRFGKLSIRFHPAPDNAYNFDFIYKRRPRRLVVDDVSAGTVTTTAGDPLVQGNGVVWSPKLVGSVFRIGFDGEDKPTGPGGAYPYMEEYTVADVPTSETLVLDMPALGTYRQFAYRISDPVDMDDATMLAAFMKMIEGKVRSIKRMKTLPEEVQAAKDALELAREADARSFAHRAAGDALFPWYRMANMPSGPDVV